MQVKELIARLSTIDPEEDIFFMDNEYGPTEIYTVSQELHHVTSANGKELPRQVWVMM